MCFSPRSGQKSWNSLLHYGKCDSVNHVTMTSPDHVTRQLSVTQPEPTLRTQARETSQVQEPGTRQKSAGTQALETTQVLEPGTRQKSAGTQALETTLVLEPGTRHSDVESHGTSQKDSRSQARDISAQSNTQTTVRLHKLNGEVLVGPVFASKSPCRKNSRRSRSKVGKHKNSKSLNNNVIYIEDITDSAEAFPGDVGTVPRNVGMQSRGVGSGPRNVGMQSRVVGSGPESGAKRVKNSSTSRETHKKPVMDSVNLSRSGRPRKIPNKYLE